MSVHLQAYSHQEVAAILPQRKKEAVDNKIQQAKKTWEKWYVNGGNIRRNWFPIVIALGVIAILGGLFLTLAAHQILPHGINTISELGVAAKIVSYSSIGLGVILAPLGAGTTYRVRKQNYITKNYQMIIPLITRNAALDKIHSYFPSRLEKNELFLVDEPSKETVFVYRQKQIEGGDDLCPIFESLSYRDSTREKAFQEWCNSHQEIVKSSTLITLETLRERTEAFEQKKHS